MQRDLAIKTVCHTDYLGLYTGNSESFTGNTFLFFLEFIY
jgi:hypothetical protein